MLVGVFLAVKYFAHSFRSKFVFERSLLVNRCEAKFLLVRWIRQNVVGWGIYGQVLLTYLDVLQFIENFII